MLGERVAAVERGASGRLGGTLARCALALGGLSLCDLDALEALLCRALQALDARVGLVVEMAVAAHLGAGVLQGLRGEVGGLLVGSAALLVGNRREAVPGGHHRERALDRSGRALEAGGRGVEGLGDLEGGADGGLELGRAELQAA